MSSQQYGFIPNISRELATLELIDRNINAMNKQLTPINIYLDLSKAFDSLDHNILVSKLQYYGVQVVFDRNQYLDLDDTQSDINEVHCGIPQGSVMGPLLFNIFINDIVEASSPFDIIMYVDDTTLVPKVSRILEYMIHWHIVYNT